MNHRRYRVIMLAAALLIIGMRGLCAAQFSQRAAIKKSDTPEWNDVQLAIPFSKSTDLLMFGTLRFGQNVGQTIDERIGGRFMFRVKRYAYLSPIYQYIWMHGGAGG